MKTFKTVEAYIASFPKKTQVILKKVRQAIKEAAPKASESISYQMPTYKLNGKYLVYFGGWKKHIGFYPIPSGMEAFKNELSKYKSGKGSAQFPLDQPIPLELIKRIVKYRVQETEFIHH